MNKDLHCVALFDGMGYYSEWLLDDKVLFSSHVREAFGLDFIDQKDVIERVSAQFKEDLVVLHDVNIMHLQEVPVFCCLEKLPELLEAALEILRLTAVPTRGPDSLESRLERYKKRWKEGRHCMLLEKIGERRRSKLISNLEECLELVESTPQMTSSIKRKRRDLAPIIYVMEKECNR